MNKLLSITIPTWNRADSLDKSLNLLLPQIEQYSEAIELIISDNYSTDNTKQVIEKYILEYKDIDIIPFYQIENTGYFGNFKKCKELANGKYFWLLSDSEFLKKNSLSILINLLSINNDIGVYYLSFSENNRNIKDFFVQNAKEFFNSESAYLITLISSVIMLNNKEHDPKTILRFNENLFLGFLFMCNALQKKDKIMTINARLFEIEHTKVSFDVFAAWTYHITSCINYMLEINLLDDSSKIKFISGILKTNLKNHIIAYRNGITNGIHNYQITELRTLINDNYSEYEAYRKAIKPYLFSSYLTFKFLQIRDKISRKLNKISKNTKNLFFNKK